MFDIGFWELALLALIGLLVLGPERLPKAARSLGLWAGRARRYIRGFTDDLERELRAEELRRELDRTRREVEHNAERDPEERQ